MIRVLIAGILVAAAAPALCAAPRIAIVIDDFGIDNISQPPDAEWTGLPGPISWAVLPRSVSTKRSAAMARDKGIELLIHFPFDPFLNLALPREAVDPGDLVKVENLLKDALVQIPGAVGLNNHISARSTRNRPLMKEFMRLLKPTGLFFLDSKTTSLSVAYDTAREASIPAAKQTIFLDTDRHDKEFCLSMLAYAKAVARKRGEAVVIGHHYFHGTLECLRQEMPAMKSAGFELVLVSQLAR